MNADEFNNIVPSAFQLPSLNNAAYIEILGQTLPDSNVFKDTAAVEFAAS